MRMNYIWNEKQPKNATKKKKNGINFTWFSSCLVGLFFIIWLSQAFFNMLYIYIYIIPKGLEYVKWKERISIINTKNLKKKKKKLLYNLLSCNFRLVLNLSLKFAYKNQSLNNIWWRLLYTNNDTYNYKVRNHHIIVWEKNNIYY